MTTKPHPLAWPPAAWTVAFGLGLALTAHASNADAYCLHSRCDDGSAGQRCVPATATDCGRPLFWAGGCLGVSLQKDGWSSLPFERVEDLVDRAFRVWRSADCGAGAPAAVHVELLEPVDCAVAEFDETGRNANVIVFHEDQWPYRGGEYTLALTTVGYDVQTGRLLDADMEINATGRVRFTVGDVDVEYDLLAVVTHEAGHVLGLAHASDGAATMHAEYSPGTTEWRTLSPDDVAAVCAVYPPGPQGACDPTPHNGFRPTCAAPQDRADSGGCSSAPGGTPQSMLLVLFFVVLRVIRGRSQSRADEQLEAARRDRGPGRSEAARRSRWGERQYRQQVPRE